MRYQVTGLVVAALVIVLSGASALAQDAARCEWAYSDTETLSLGSMSWDDCTGKIYNLLIQYAMDEIYAVWGDTGMYIDSDGNMMTADLAVSGDIEWLPAGNIAAGTTAENNPLPSPPDEPTPEPAAEDHAPLTLDEIFTLAEADINDYWSQQFQAAGDDYIPPQIVLYESSRIRTGCGRVEENEGPLYCPIDHTAYFPRDFMQEEMESVGDFAVVVVIAHEWGHAVQNLANLDSELTIDAELQADCFAGAYSRYAGHDSVRILLDEGDIDEGSTAFYLFGDPEGTDYFDEDAHGSGEQRYQAFEDGLQGGYTVCMDNNR